MGKIRKLKDKRGYVLFEISYLIIITIQIFVLLLRKQPNASQITKSLDTLFSCYRLNSLEVYMNERMNQIVFIK